MESEYIALSLAMRELVVMQTIFDEVKEILQLPGETKTTISREFEDNEAARKLASPTMPKLTPRSKHIAVTFHWIREKLEPLNIVILSIDTKDQLGDIFTKGLTQKEFESKRKLVSNW